MVQQILRLDKASVSLAVQLLKEEKLVAIPTETVYGLAALATSSLAVARIYALKERPSFNPLICHVANLKEAERIGVFSPLARQLAVKFWPGPLTLVVPLQPDHPLSDLSTAGLSTVGLRVPGNPLICQLICHLGVPLAAPSANLSESISPTSAMHVATSFQGDARLPLILDDGPCPIGIESTILDMTQERPHLLRAGGLSLEEIQIIVGPVVCAVSSDALIKSPGQLKRHYAPQKPLRMNVLTPTSTEAYLTFGPGPFKNSPAYTLNLSEQGSLQEAACNLFSMLRLLDDSPTEGIAVHPIPFKGLGLGINDRLQRASFQKD